MSVTATPHDLTVSVSRADDDTIGTRTALPFSVASAFPDVEVRTA